MDQPAELTTITARRIQCRHIHAAGKQCGSPALRHEQFCYFHHTTRPRKPAAGKFRHLDAHEPFQLPVVEDHPVRTPPTNTPQPATANLQLPSCNSRPSRP